MLPATGNDSLCRKPAQKFANMLLRFEHIAVLARRFGGQFYQGRARNRVRKDFAVVEWVDWIAPGHKDQGRDGNARPSSPISRRRITGQTFQPCDSLLGTGMGKLS